MEISASLQAKSRLQHAAAAQGKQLDEAIRTAKEFAARVAESLHLDSVTQELAAEDELDMKMVHDQLTQELKERLISSATREKQGDLTSTSVRVSLCSLWWWRWRWWQWQWLAVLLTCCSRTRTLAVSRMCCLSSWLSLWWFLVA